jgi:hypothetical protein
MVSAFVVHAELGFRRPEILDDRVLPLLDVHVRIDSRFEHEQADVVAPDISATTVEPHASHHDVDQRDPYGLWQTSSERYDVGKN